MWRSRRTEVRRSCIDVVFVPIEGGSFVMGSNDGPRNERPAHRVHVDSFALAAHQTTNAEYASFVDATGHAAPPFWNDAAFNDPRQPVVGVSWFDAVAYCEWLGVRLPTEAEWERAARGGFDGLRYPWGDTPPQSRPDYDTRWRTAPERVAQQAPNAFGLYDMCENVHEWCSDWYSASYYADSPSHNPPGPVSGTRRVSRGGSWRHAIKISRCAARSSIPPDFHYADYGFRVAAM
jgi:formylglycine-generating enzyme required for sulfatase activity